MYSKWFYGGRCIIRGNCSWRRRNTSALVVSSIVSDRCFRSNNYQSIKTLVAPGALAAAAVARRVLLPRGWRTAGEIRWSMRAIVCVTVCLLDEPFHGVEEKQSTLLQLAASVKQHYGFSTCMSFRFRQNSAEKGGSSKFCVEIASYYTFCTVFAYHQHRK